MFKPFHQAGLHMTNYLIEDYNNVQENLKMQYELVKNYEESFENGVFIGDEDFRMEQSEVDQIKSFFH